MMTLKKELKAVAQYTKSFFGDYNRPNLIYHNLNHTQDVAENAKLIADSYNLSDEEYYITIAAAWMHDLGYYVNNNAVNHEVESAKLAVDFLKERGFEENIIEGVRNGILATKLPQSPQTLPEQILCDADLFHLGTDAFTDRQKVLKREMEFFKQDKIDKKIWLNDTFQLMMSHSYHTSYCQTLLNKKKEKNLKKLKEKLEEEKIAINKQSVQQEDATDLPPQSDVVNLKVAEEKMIPVKAKSRAKSIRQNTYAVAKFEPITTDVQDSEDNEKTENIESNTESNAINSVENTDELSFDSNDTIIVDASKNNDESQNNTFADETSSDGSKHLTNEDILIDDSDNNHLFFKKQLKKKNEIKAAKKTSRGTETVFRVTSSNNQQLSAQADNKANIMITVNSIIISVLLTVLLGKLEEQPNLLIPNFILLAVNVSTIIFAVLATRPNIPSGMFNAIDVETKKVNLLFFGNFYKMTLEEYSKGMLTMMDDRDFLYGSLIQDVYNQGLVLAKKYRLLRISYSIFMYGLIASVIAFVIFSFTTSPDESVIH